LSFPPESKKQRHLYVLRKGAISLFSKKGRLLGKLSGGNICTVFCMKEDYKRFTIKVEEDTLVYAIFCDALQKIFQDDLSILSFMQKTSSQRLKIAVDEMMDGTTLVSPLMHMTTHELMYFPVVTIGTGSTIYQAAKKMVDTRVSSLVRAVQY
jgi:CBS domain-containing protein